MGLKLSITPTVSGATALEMTFLDSSANSAVYNPYTLTLVDLNFNKQMYQPCEINARIQIKISAQSISLYDLQKKFLNANVSLSESVSGNVIASNYYVQELVFEKSTTTSVTNDGATTYNTTLYSQFKIFSLDKLLTLKRDNRTFVAKRLANDILSDEAKGVKLPYDSTATLWGATNKKLVKIALRKKLVNPVYKKDAKGNNTTEIDYEKSSEYIQPYIVQHDESIYDMLIRTANRWGEFVYFENGNLVIGCDSSDSGKTITDGYSITYKNDATPSIRDIVTNDDYLEVITKNNYIKHAGDMWSEAPDGVYAHKIMQSFVNMPGSVLEWMTDRAIDDTITAGKNDKYLKEKEQEYNDKFFNNPLNDSSDTLKDLHYNSDKNECRQFATYENDGGLTSKAYQDVLDYELKAGKEELCIDLGVNYQHLLLGHIIKIKKEDSSDQYIDNYDQYLVTRVECTVDKETKLKKSPLQKYEYYLEEEKQLHFRVYAVKEVATDVFYPPMLPTGHVRFSGPLRGVVVDTMDPKMQCRYRVTNNGQYLGKDNDGKYISKGASPWICVSHEMLSKGGGSAWCLELGTEVLLDFKYGNVELPFIAGVLQNSTAEVTRHSMFNNMSYQTPAGHAVRMTDGYGAGAANFIADFIPIVGMIKGFYPEGSAWHTKEENVEIEDYQAYEGGIELTDKYGIYSIKASTDERNISIKSPYGDVTLNAFTGITISAPNGNVKIQGKNVSIEAGNSLTLISGKNIEKGFLGSVTLGHGMDANNKLGAALCAGVKQVMGKAVSLLDFPLLRHTWEVILRPVAGVMELRSHRAMKIHAGINAQETTTNMYADGYGWAEAVTNNNNLAQMVFGTHSYRINDTKDIWKRNLCNNGEIVIERIDNNNNRPKTDRFDAQNDGLVNQVNQVNQDDLDDQDDGVEVEGQDDGVEVEGQNDREGEEGQIVVDQPVLDDRDQEEEVREES